MTCMSTLGVVVQHDGLLEITYMQVYNPQSARSYLLELIRHGSVLGSLIKTVTVAVKDRCSTPSMMVADHSGLPQAIDSLGGLTP